MVAALAFHLCQVLVTGDNLIVISSCLKKSENAEEILKSQDSLAEFDALIQKLASGDSLEWLLAKPLLARLLSDFRTQVTARSGK